MKPAGNKWGSDLKRRTSIGKVFESSAAPKFGHGVLGGWPLVVSRPRLAVSIYGFEPMPRNGYPSQLQRPADGAGQKRGYGFVGLLETPAPLRYCYEPLVVPATHEIVMEVFGNGEHCSSEIASSSSAVP